MAKAEGRKHFGWILQLPKVAYDRVLDWQRRLVKLRKNGMVRDMLIFVEHPPVVTVGKDGHENNYKDCPVEPVFIERGGDVTYHGPGQLVVYFIFNLSRRGKDLHVFMEKIQKGIIDALAEYNIEARTDDTNTGVWVNDKKIASIGIAVKNWITFHGTAININTDLAEFKKINPCGLQSEIMTSLTELNKKRVELDEFGKVLLEKYSEVFDTSFYSVDLDEIAEDIESQAGGNVI